MGAVNLKATGHKQLAHMSDAWIEAWGPSLEAAFLASAAGLLSVITDLRRVKRRITVNVPALKDIDLEGLLYSWLEYVLIRFETERLILPKGSITIRTSGGGNGNYLMLTGRLEGEAFDPGRHLLRREVKAVTYHQMEVSRINDIYRIRFLLDL
jgi:SHS2 domain-containing protein